MQRGVIARKYLGVLAAGIHEGRKEQGEHRHVAEYENPDSLFARDTPGSIGDHILGVRSPYQGHRCN